MHQVVGLRPRMRRRFEPAGWFGRKTREVQETTYYWTVDGIDLTTWLIQQRTPHHRDLEPPTDQTIWLAGNTDDALDRLERLQGHHPPDFADGRVALLSCPVCGDFGCGTFTAELLLTNETATWHRLGWNSEGEEGSPFLFVPSMSVTFDRSEYDQTLEAAKRLVRQESDPAPRGV